MPRAQLIQQRGGTASQWASANPVLALREKGVETDTLKEKLGDGVTAWSSLPYFNTSTAMVADATTTSKGIVQLAGDLGGNASAPTVPGLSAKEPTINAGTTSQYWRGDKTFQTLNKSAVGLGNVDNTSDANKPVSTATQTALNAKYDASNPSGFINASQAAAAAPVQSVAGRTGSVTLTKSDVGLTNVDNTSDASKPISTAVQTALASKVSKSGDTVLGPLQVGQGYAAYFSGDANSLINSGNNSALLLGETTKPFSINVRINIDSTYAATAQKFVMFLSNRYFIRIETSLKITGSVWGGTALSSTTTLVRGTTYDITFTYDGNNIVLYVNGTQEAATTTITTASGSNILYVGLRQGITGSEFKGIVDTPRIYNRALTATEVSNIATTGIAPSSGLVYELTFDDKTTYDTSPINNISTATGVTYVSGLSNPALDSGNMYSVVGATQILGALKAATINAPDKGSQVFNVKSYGAKGNNIADDTTFIQAAINAASAVNGTVLFPGGTYKITSRLIANSNLTMKSVSSSGATITGNFNDALFGTTKTGTTKTVYSNITLENLKFVSQFGHGVAIFNTSWVNIKNCEVMYTNTSPIREAMWVQYSQFIVVDGNYLHDLTGNGVQINASDYFQVVNNHVVGNNSTSTQDDGIDIDCDFLDTASIPSRWGVVANNTIQGIPNGCSIRVEDSSYVAVVGNVATGNTTNGAVAGININESATAATNNLSTKHITVVGNTISNCVTAGIATSGLNLLRDIVISNNVLENCGQVGDGSSRARAGILLNGQYVITSNNYLYNCGINNADSGAIMVYKSSNQFVINNTVISSPNAIRIWNGNGSTVYTNVQLNQNILRGNTADYVGDLAQAGVKVISIDANGSLGINAFVPNSTLQVNGSFATNVVTKTANYTVTLQDQTILVDTSAGNVTVTLITATGIAGRTYDIKKISTDTNTLTIATTGSQNIYSTVIATSIATTATTMPSFTLQAGLTSGGTPTAIWIAK